ncbi:hypothetical protein CLV97_11834 [Planifilum fimeticola]|jgi:hypothetical protein|uniref:Uncharacterized protein n=1 Tax=Planifilum fimeticola TaxID=201975 RepID=A0A2T0LDM8_9BACL|nr:hypothetical protein [Planifilum fimeticola]PRX39959.1 hypothetical protein CLV97_11834 [Planifilum fimeticola]
MKALIIFVSLLLVLLFLIKAVIMFFKYRKTPKDEWGKLHPEFYKWIAVAFLAMGLMDLVDLSEGEGSVVSAAIKLILSVVIFFESRRRKRLAEKDQESL